MTSELVNKILHEAELNGFDGESILDLGCNDGTYQKRLTSVKNYTTKVGVDISKEALNKFDKLHKNDWSHIKGEALETIKAFMDDSFDVVIISDLLMYIQKNKALEIIKEAKRICKGFVFVFTPSVDKISKYKRLDGSVTNLHEEDLKDFFTLRMANFHVDDTGMPFDALFGIYINPEKNPGLPKQTYDFNSIITKYYGGQNAA